MGDRASRLATAVWTSGLRAEAWRDARAVSLECPEEIRPLGELLMKRPPRNTVFFEALLSHLPSSDWPPLIASAMSFMTPGATNEVAQRVTEHAALESPESLRPHLEQLFTLDDYFLSGSAAHAWRGATDEEVPHLERALSASDADLRDRARRCLLEIRTPTALLAAARGRSEEELSPLLFQVGYERRGDFLRLFEPTPHHLLFPPGYCEELPAHTQRDLHPTWSSPRVGTELRFGGRGSSRCTVCDGESHHLVTLDPIPPSVGVTRRSRLVLETCLSCVGWSTRMLFHHHDDTGAPRALPVDVRRAPEFPAAPLPETRAQSCDLGPRWRWQEWGLSNGRENLHRVGGHPSWVQSAEYPSCPECRGTMHFLLQLDSGLQGWMWGSGGMLYVFFCDRCSTSAQLWQCT